MRSVPVVTAISGSRRTRGSAYERCSGGSSGGHCWIGQARAKLQVSHSPGARFSTCQREKQ